MASFNISINDWRNSVLWCENLNITHKAVACAICSFYRPDKHCFPSYTTLCEMLNVSRATISASIKSLVKYKFLEVKKGEIQRLSSLTNFYVFVGVNDSLPNSSSDSLPNSSSDSLPSELEIREEENIGNKGNIYTSQDKSCSVKKLPKISFAEVVDFETLFTYWEQNKKGGKYKTPESRQRQLEKLRKLTNDNLSYAKDAITFSIDAGYQGFTDGQVLYYKGKYDPDAEFWEMVSKQAREYEEEQKNERAV